MAITSLAFVFAIIYAILGLVVGGIVTVINKSYLPQLPFTVIVFFIGLGVSTGIQYYFDQASDGQQGYDLELATQIDYLPENSRFAERQ